jgi:hypothetical protein
MPIESSPVFIKSEIFGQLPNQFRPRRPAIAGGLHKTIPLETPVNSPYPRQAVFGDAGEESLFEPINFAIMLAQKPLQQGFHLRPISSFTIFP